ncbi:hypothetical protein T484DRAFT_3628380, partial [Baffinella frigidus]
RTHFLAHACTLSLTHARTHALTSWRTHALYHSLTHARTHSLPGARMHSLRPSTKSAAHPPSSSRWENSRRVLRCVSQPYWCTCLPQRGAHAYSNPVQTLTPKLVLFDSSPHLRAQTPYTGGVANTNPKPKTAHTHTHTHTLSLSVSLSLSLSLSVALSLSLSPSLSQNRRTCHPRPSSKSAPPRRSARRASSRLMPSLTLHPTPQTNP